MPRPGEQVCGQKTRLVGRRGLVWAKQELSIQKEKKSGCKGRGGVWSEEEEVNGQERRSSQEETSVGLGAACPGLAPPAQSRR